MVESTATSIFGLGIMIELWRAVSIYIRKSLWLPIDWARSGLSSNLINLDHELRWIWV